MKNLLIVVFLFFGAASYSHAEERRDDIMTTKDVAAIAHRISLTFMARIIDHNTSGALRGDDYVQLSSMIMVAAILSDSAMKDGNEYIYRKSKEMIIYVERKLKELESSQQVI